MLDDLPTLILSAAWIAPMDGPLLRDSALVIRDRIIVDIGPVASLRGKYPYAVVEDQGRAVLLPGLVNSHVHLELSSLTQPKSPSSFVDWLLGVMSTAGSTDAAVAMKLGIAQCLKFGVTTVGDITSQPAITRPILGDSPLGGISFGEVRAMGQRRHFLESRLAAAAEPSPAGSSWVSGISPHAPYSIEIDGYRQCLQVARSMHLPLATHLAETPAEAEFLAHHSGPFKTLWDVLAAWDDSVPTSDGGPIRFARAIGLLDYPTLLAHVNVCDDAELDLLANGIASVVYCPRTHDYFNRPPHRFREMLARGINVAIGTDSCASSPDLNLLDDLRLIHQLAPEMPARDIFKLATTRAAVALGLNNVGALSPGKHANVISFAVESDDPLLEIIEQPKLPTAVWIAGKQLKEGGS